MFSRKYLTQKLRFFVQNRSSVLIFGAGFLLTFHYYDKILTNIVENEIKSFKNGLSPEQKKEMESSPAMNEKYMKKCEEKIIQNFRCD